MKTSIACLIITIIWRVALAQTVEINPKEGDANAISVEHTGSPNVAAPNVPPAGAAPSIIFAGGVSGAWMSVNRANIKDPDARGFDPSYTYITCQFKPIVARKGDGWVITFQTDLPGFVP